MLVCFCFSFTESIKLRYRQLSVYNRQIYAVPKIAFWVTRIIYSLQLLVLLTLFLRNSHSTFAAEKNKNKNTCNLHRLTAVYFLINDLFDYYRQKSLVCLLANIFIQNYNYSFFTNIYLLDTLAQTSMSTVKVHLRFPACSGDSRHSPHLMSIHVSQNCCQA